MTSATPSTAREHAIRMPVFRRILCGVDGGRPARHAMERALALAGDGAAVDFVAVCDARGVGATGPVVALAARIARAHGSALTLIHAGDRTPEERHPGLIVVGSGGEKGLGSVSERVAMRAPASVLIVRPGAGRRP